MGVSEVVLFVCLVFGQIAGYIPQYGKILQGRGEGFSTLVSLVLLLANTLRIFYWIGARFAVTLLWQSIVMIAAQLILLQAWCQAQRKKLQAAPNRRLDWSIFDLDFAHFWQWTDWFSYLCFMALFASCVGLVSLMFLDSEAFVEFLGMLALGVEATLALPQLIKNQKKRSTEGLSLALVASWFIGDVFKTIYFVAQDQPTPFVVCGALQIVVDLLIGAQIAIFGPKNDGFQKLSVSMNSSSSPPSWRDQQQGRSSPNSDSPI